MCGSLCSTIFDAIRVKEYFESSSRIMNLYEALRVLLAYQRFNAISFLDITPSRRLAVTLTSQVAPFLNFILCWSVVIVFGLFFHNFRSPANIQDLNRPVSLSFYAILIQNVAQTGVYSIIFTLAWQKRSDELKIYEQLYEIDEKLSKKFGIDLNYGGLRRITGWVVFAVTSALVFVIPVLCGVYAYISVESSTILVNLIFLIMQLNTLCALTVAYCFVVYLLKQRLQAFRIHIQKPGIVDVMSRAEFDEVLKTYRQMRQVVKTINNAHGLKQMLNTLSDFAIVTHELYFTLEILVKTNVVNLYVVFSAFICVIWAAINFGKMFMTCFLTHTTLAEVHETSRILKAMTYRSTEKHSLELVNFFGISIIHNEISFHASDYFKIDMTLMLAVTSAICTYFVILLQFE